MLRGSMPSIESSTSVLRHHKHYLVHKQRQRFVTSAKPEPWPRGSQLPRPLQTQAYQNVVAERPANQWVSRHAATSSGDRHKRQSSSSDTLEFKPKFHNNYSVGVLIGEGSYGKVHVATCKQTQEQWAVKILPKHRRNRSTEQNMALIYGEVNAWRSVQESRHVARLEDVYEDEDNVYIIQELCLGGDLKLFLQEHGPLSELESAEVVGAVLDVIAECHSHGICYGDVKPANFLLKWPYAEGDCKELGTTPGRLDLRVVDFGCSQTVGAIRRKSGTPLYMAPEMFQTSHGLPADVWAVGVVLYQLLTGRLPFWDTDLDKLQNLPPHDIVAGIQYNAIRLGSRFKVDLSDDVQDLLRRMLNRYAPDRITAEQALQHSWLRSTRSAVQSHPLSPTAFQSADIPALCSGDTHRNSSLDSSLGSQSGLFDALSTEPEADRSAGTDTTTDLQGLSPEDIQTQDDFLLVEQSRFSVSSEGNALSGNRANNVVRLPFAMTKQSIGTGSDSAVVSTTEP